MKQKSRRPKGYFKLQVYVSDQMVKEVDEICDYLRIYRSGFVTEAITKALQLTRNRKILDTVNKAD